MIVKTRIVRLGAILLLAGSCLAGFVPASLAQTASDPLERAFNDPPMSARPRVWWHWMNGNITEDGIRKDLEWMKRSGIGGLQNFDANLATPKVVDQRLVYMTPEWKHAFRYAATLSDRLGLELAIASSPGWSETGGPWVSAKDGLKKLVWSETSVAGGKPFKGILAAPPSVSGPYQALPKAADIMSGIGGKFTPPTFYADAAVLAYPVVRQRATVTPRVLSASGAVLDGAAMFDDDSTTGLRVSPDVDGQPTSVIFDYGTQQTFRSATIFVPTAVAAFATKQVARLEVGDADGNWRLAATITPGPIPQTVAFPTVTGSRFRLVFAAGKVPKIAEFRLLGEARIDEAETKAAFAIAPDYYALTTAAASTDRGVAPSAVIDLTARMKPDGRLDWMPPKGDWHILRLGYSLTGKTNHPASAEATGLEVDKFDAAAVRAYLETYLGMYESAAGKDLIGRRGVRAFLTDSTEIGATNWTPRLVAEFKRLRGYDPTPWLPALTGVLIGTRAQSDSFLYDFRRTLADLMASAHYGTVAEVAHEHGLNVYGEALEDHRPVIGDDMAMRSHTDVPMAAMWNYTRKAGPRASYLADIKGAASVAHLYGQNLVAAESLTSLAPAWSDSPADLRRVIDLEFALGVNRPVIHTSVHQPLDKAPGLSLYFIGQFFNRHESWGEMARPWMDYMARNSLMLQSGRNVADVAYFYGEEAPLTGLYGDKPVADAPTRYGYDFANADVLRDVLSVDHGDLVAKSGARYRLLYLGGSSRRMTLATLRRIADLVQQGATVVGDAPTGSPGLGDDAAAYAALVATLWPKMPTARIGQGRVIAGHDVEAALAAVGVAPDFTYTKPQTDSQLLFAHRKLDDGDVYFVNNRQNRDEQVEARFRVTGKTPEIWRADSGKAEPVSYRIEGGETVVPLDFGPEESFFVVFRKAATANARTVPKAAMSQIAMLDGPWKVAFQADRGAPASITLPTLASLSEQNDPGVKYFSGVATYSKNFALPRGVRPGAPLSLDLGKVAVIAEVRVNGRLIGTSWHAPYKIDIGSAVRPGRNTLDIRVADLWVNRLIGDAQPGAIKVAFTTVPTYNAKSALVPAGLIGPVTISAAAPD